MEQPAAHVPLPFFPISQMFGPLLDLLHHIPLSVYKNMQTLNLN